MIVEVGILLNFHGILTHDCWYAYDCFDVTHAICCAHFLRELNYLEENTKLTFPTKVKNTLLNLKDRIEKGQKDRQKNRIKFLS